MMTFKVTLRAICVFEMGMVLYHSLLPTLKNKLSKLSKVDIEIHSQDCSYVLKIIWYSYMVYVTKKTN